MFSLLFLYKNAARLSTPLLKCLLEDRRKRGKEDAKRLHERMGQAHKARPAGALVWVHAASVGEAQSALILIDAIGRAHPGINILVTTGTLTSAGLMAQRLPPFAFHQFIPLDHPAWVSRFLDHWKPDLALWMESELWPNMLGAIKKRKIPAILVNARLSDRSFTRWKMFAETAQTVLSAFSLVLAQTEKDAARFEKLGTKKSIATDNLKYSAAPLPHDPVALNALRLSIEGRPCWVYASTHAGEETLACRIHKRLKETLPHLLTIIVPRHPERREDIAKTCFEESVKYRLRSEHNALPAPDDDLYIADTLGELGLFYALCPIAMIGRSFSDDGGGGHNPLEAAQLGCVVMTGPNNQYQRPIYDDMRAAAVVAEVYNEYEFYNTLKGLLETPGLCEPIKQKTIQFAEQKIHVVDTVMEQLTSYLRGLEKKYAA